MSLKGPCFFFVFKAVFVGGGCTFFECFLNVLYNKTFFVGGCMFFFVFKAGFVFLVVP